MSNKNKHKKVAEWHTKKRQHARITMWPGMRGRWVTEQNTDAKDSLNYVRQKHMLR